MKDEYKGLQLEYEVIRGDYEGDLSEPGLSRKIPAYVEGLTVKTWDGTDITEWLTQEAYDDIIEYLNRTIDD